MKQLSYAATAAIPLLLLAACDSGTPESETTGSLPDASEPPAVTEPAAETPAAIPTAIPAALQGRWGMVPADCEPGRPDAKGLLVIDGTTLEFYESVGNLGAITQGGPTSIRASFDFTGEGMEWKREIALAVQDNGSTLIRREYGADAAPDPFRYAKCS